MQEGSLLSMWPVGPLDNSPRARYHDGHDYRDTVTYEIRDGLVSEQVSILGSIHI